MKKIERKNKGKIKAKKAKKLPKMASIKWLIGIDEVGRGPLAGPVAVCACTIPYHKNPKESYKKFLKKYKKEIKALKLPSLHMRDSKKLSAAQREDWSDFLKKTDAIFAYASATANEIDGRGIAVCIFGLIEKNLRMLSKKHLISSKNSLVLLDGALKAPRQYLLQTTIIKGDEKEEVISMASIIAKVTRDEYMDRQSKKEEFKVFGFDRHKGYGTENHRNAIVANGLSSLHRRSFCTRILKNRNIS